MAVALNVPQNHQPMSWVPVKRFQHTFNIRDFEYEVGTLRVIGSTIISHICMGQQLVWEVAVVICEDGLVNLVYRLIGQDPIQSNANIDFWISASTYLKGLDGQKITYSDTMSGNNLPSFRNEPNCQCIWNASIHADGPHVTPETRPLDHYLCPREMTLNITFHLDIWQSGASLDANTPVFDVRSLNNLPEQLQNSVVDVGLVTNEGIILAHFKKVCTEFPGLIADLTTAPKRDGFMWGHVNEPFATVRKLVNIMYDSYDDDFEGDIVELLLAANRLNLKKVYPKIIHWQPNNQPPPQ
ncbi:unnamed protein product [Orchesella dallaii]|uniref:Uncharacterized protein n=1 Tax=Orchesella dallaii TaxID=48710 RepID=A0ABP1R712_9HEXA